MRRDVPAWAIAFVCAAATLTGGSALAATQWPTTVSGAICDPYSCSGNISSAQAGGECISHRVVSAFQKKPDGTKRVLGEGKTNASGHFDFPEDKPWKADLGDITVRAAEKRFGHPVTICDEGKATAVRI